MKSRLPLFFLALILLAGCIEFERQTVTYSYDAAHDTLKIFQDYHGIFGADSTNSLSTEELQQLDSVLNSQRTFFFGNWISEISHEQLGDQLKQIKESAKDGKLEPREAHLEALLKLLLDNSKIENGGFYIDSNKKLSGVQRVTLTGVSKLIAAGNVAIQDALEAEANDSTTKPEEREVYRKAAEKQQDCIKLDGNRITVQFPATKRQYEEWLSPNNGQKQVEELRKSGGQFGFTNDQVTVSIGQPADKQTSLSLSFSEKTYVTNLLEVVKKRGLVQEKYDPQAAAKVFLSGGK